MTSKELAEDIINHLDQRERIVSITERIKKLGIADRCGEKVDEGNLRVCLNDIDDYIIKMTNLLIRPKNS